MGLDLGLGARFSNRHMFGDMPSCWSCFKPLHCLQDQGAAFRVFRVLSNVFASGRKVYQNRGVDRQPARISQRSWEIVLKDHCEGVVCKFLETLLGGRTVPKEID